ncbi:GNAT family N-acetyltransferase [Actinomadura flavalba]|uniref:GNAT family N-acetyltransferase n=1 Tax=Actinomadura flavalba TaxID=1120938 RepID=UPI0003766479|nr:GNAT family N-acetyltransferase [Actinomadura flavalba]
MKQLTDPVALPEIRVRPYGITDAGRLRAMPASRASLYTRFLTGTPRVPDAYVRSLAALDHWDHDALAALHGDALVGVAEYVRDPRRRDHAELAVLIADPWQRHGLGRLLVDHLTVLARRRGITDFDADVAFGNHPALTALHHGWPGARAGTGDGTVRFHLPFPVP